MNTFFDKSEETEFGSILDMKENGLEMEKKRRETSKTSLGVIVVWILPDFISSDASFIVSGSIWTRMRNNKQQ